MGDGKCGWRALAVGYFETLLDLRDATKIQQEIARFKMLNVSCDDDTNSSLDEFSEEWFKLLEQLQNAALSGIVDGNTVAAKFNEPMDSENLIFYLKVC